MTGHLDIKNGKYQMVLNVYRDGKRTRKTISTGLTVKGNKTRAEKMLRETIRDFEMQEEAARQAILSQADRSYQTFAETTKNWLEKAKTRIDPVTYEGYATLVNHHISPYFEGTGVLLRDLTRKDIQDFFDLKAKSGRVRGKGGLSPRTLRVLRCVIHQTLARAVRDGLVSHNVCEDIDLPASVRHEANFFTRGQMEDFLSAIKGESLYPLILVTYTYGLRRSEVLGLQWDCVDFENDLLTIRRTVVRGSEVYEKDKTKNQTSRRSFPLLPEIKTLLQNIKVQQEETQKLCGKSYHKSNYVFTWQDGRPYAPDYVSHKFSKLLKQYGFPHIRFHELRHSSGSNLLCMGFTLKDVQEWLGHSDIKMTANIYGHLDAQRKQTLADAMSFGKTVATA